MSKKATVHVHPDRFEWTHRRWGTRPQRRTFARNEDGQALLVRAVTEAGYEGVRLVRVKGGRR